MLLAAVISAAVLLLVAGTWLLEVAFRGAALLVRALAWTALLLLWLGWAALNPREAAAQWRKAEALRKAGLFDQPRLTARP